MDPPVENDAVEGMFRIVLRQEPCPRKHDPHAPESREDVSRAYAANFQYVAFHEERQLTFMPANVRYRTFAGTTKHCTCADNE